MQLLVLYALVQLGLVDRSEQCKVFDTHSGGGARSKKIPHTTSRERSTSCSCPTGSRRAFNHRQTGRWQTVPRPRNDSELVREEVCLL
jgi:hypothetical protein